MAHEFETGFFVGTPAWHGLGTVLEDAPTIDEAIVQAGLDWRVRLGELVLAEDAADLGPNAQGLDLIPREIRHHAVLRETDGRVLGVVGPSWEPLQNVDALRWFQPLIDDGTCTLEAAGSLREGERIWVLARPKDHMADVAPGDPLSYFVLLAHGHDGRLGVHVGFTPVRVVCMNTLSMSLADAQHGRFLKMHHRAGLDRALVMARQAMSLARRSFELTIEQAQFLRRQGCSRHELERYIKRVVAPAADPEDEATAKRVLPKVVPLFADGAGNKGESYWDAYNAVTQWATHERGRTADTRLQSQWFGEGARLIDRALETALEMAA